MRILRIKLSNYRGTTEREVAFAPGVTIVEGPNEIGKSSLAEALDLVFKYPDSSGAKAVKDTFPVQRDASPEIEVELVTGTYHLVYRKRFGKGASTELEITEPPPTNEWSRSWKRRSTPTYGRRCAWTREWPSTRPAWRTAKCWGEHWTQPLAAQAW